MPEIVEHDRAVEMRFHKSFGARRHTPERELEAVYGDRAPSDGQEVSRDCRSRLVSSMLRRRGPLLFEVRRSVRPLSPSCCAIAVGDGSSRFAPAALRTPSTNAL